MSNKILVKSLKKLHQLQKSGNVFQSSELSPTDIRVLKKSGFIKPIIKGWYHLNSPDSMEKESTIWYASVWEFVAKYLKHRFKDNYCLNAEASLSLHAKDTIIPKQIIVMLKKGSPSTVTLPLGISMLMYSDSKNFSNSVDVIKKINIMPVELALCKTGPQFFMQKQKEVEILFEKIKEPSSLIRVLLQEDRMHAAAGRIVGVLYFLNREDEAKRVKSTYENATLKYIHVTNPFEKDAKPLISNKGRNSAALRIEALWNQYRDKVAYIGQKLVQNKNITKDTILNQMSKSYHLDAYHSLSIEGYRVTMELVQRVARGDWNPEINSQDRKNRDAMAARGYYEAFGEVKKSLLNSLSSQTKISKTIYKEHHRWYEALFSPSVQTGILEAYHLAGYRDTQVYLRGSSHVPLAKEDIADALLVLFECLENEEDMFVCAVLGHHLFGFIHPYIDGNGRIARFMMNSFLLMGGYSWVTIKVEDRDKYMKSLEVASVYNDIEPFANFIRDNINA